jgi:hypothetical protein
MNSALGNGRRIMRPWGHYGAVLVLLGVVGRNKYHIVEIMGKAVKRCLKK